MKKWQREYLSEHREKFTEKFVVNTRVQEILIEYGGFSRGDFVNQEATNESPEETTQIMDILIQKPHGYAALGIAAYETKQQLVFSWVLCGLLLHMGRASKFSCTVDDFLVAVKKCGTTTNFYKYFRDHVDGDQPLIPDTVPAPREGGRLYISRCISNRVKLNKKIFQENCNDVFVFKGITRLDLSKLAKRTTAFSTDQILQEKLSSRFILLVKENHWEPLAKMSREPIHLINVDSTSKSYILERSSADSEVITQFAEANAKKESLYETEQEFLERVDTYENRHGVCICDSPGMGKTWLLENLAREVRLRFPDRLVAFISLPKLLAKLLLVDIQPTGEFLMDNLQAIHLVLQCIFPKGASPSEPRTLISNLVANRRVRLELFLDGFDEVTLAQVRWTKGFLKALGKNAFVRLFVASRPHMRKHLEETIGVRAYDLLPFSEKDQIDFLLRLWSSGDPDGNKERLEHFARACLERLRDMLSGEGTKLFGIPLQCFLWGVVTRDKALFYAQQDDPVDMANIPVVKSITDIYHKYVEGGLQKSWDFCVQTTQSKEEKTLALKAFHVWKAIDLLFPEVSDDLFRLSGLRSQEVDHEHYACGLLYKDSSSSSASAFIHRTLAEFLVAEYLAQVVTGKDPFEGGHFLRKHHCLLLEFLLSTHSSYAVEIKNRQFYKSGNSTLPVELKILSFIFDASTMIQLFDDCLEQRDVCSFSNIHSLDFLLEEDKSCRVLLASFMCGCSNVIRLLRALLKKVILHPAQGDQLRSALTCRFWKLVGKELPDDYFPSCCAHLCFATKYANITAVEEVYAFFRECLEENLDDTCARMPVSMKTPLHFAVERHNYALVEYFVRRISLEGRGLLLYAVFDSLECDPEEIRKKAEICELLLKNCSTLTQEECLSKHIHPDLVKILAERGAFQHINKEKLHFGFPEMEASTVSYLLNAPDFPKFKDKLLRQVVMKEGMLENVKLLIAKGADPLAKSPFGKGVLHLVAVHGFVEVARYLVREKKLSLKDRDDHGNTPLLLAVRHTEMVKYLLAEKADILAETKMEENIAHKTAEICNDELLEYLLTLREAPRLFGVDDLGGKTPLHTRLSDPRPGLKVATVKKILALKKFPVDDVDLTEENYFLAAVRGGREVEVLELLTAAGVNPKAANKYGATALHLAAKNRDLPAAQYLVGLEVEMEARDANGNTPLLFVRDLELLRFLVVKGANIEAVDNDGNNIAHQAAALSIEIIGYLLTLPQAVTLFTAKNKKGVLPLHSIVSSSLFENWEVLKPILKVCKSLLETDNAPQTEQLRLQLMRRTPLSLLQILPGYAVSAGAVDPLGRNALHWAAIQGNLGRTQYLVSLGVSLEHQDNQGETPLLAADPAGEVQKYLIETGADINVVNREGNNMAHKVNMERNAYQNVNEYTVYLITELGVPQLFTRKNKKERTPLQEWLTQPGLYLKPETIELILGIPGVEVNALDIYGRNAFYSAVMAEFRLPVLQVLHKFGADAHVEDSEGQNLVHRMASCGCLRTVEYLVSLGVSGEKRDNKGSTPLLLGAQHGDVIKYLVLQGSNILATDNSGNNIAHNVVQHYTGDLDDWVSDVLQMKKSEDLFKTCNSQGRTPLHQAMLSPGVNLSKKSVDRILRIPGVEVNAPDEAGDTLFSAAVQTRKSLEVLEVLIEHKANPNVTNNKGQNALHVFVDSLTATEHDDGGIFCRFLIARGCDRKRKDCQGRTLVELVALKKREYKEDSNYSKFRAECKEIVGMIRGRNRKMCCSV